MTINIDQNAPMIARKEILISAPIEKIWMLETDIERWPEWQPGVSAAHLDGDLAAGHVFRWKAQGLSITSTLQLVERPRRIGWTGKAIGIDAVHVWTFEPRGTDTRVVSEESWSGWFTRILKLLDDKMLEKSVEKSLQFLKMKAEQP
jgi:uncharacterized protein YndB with AHSA1/START domain